MRQTIFNLCLAIMIVFSAELTLGVECTDPVNTAEGAVAGKVDRNPDSCAYLGIPYAKPPVKELRFRAPQPPENRNDVLKAEKFGNSCIQNEAIGAGGKSEGFSEDCLFINIWRPKKPGKYPVMFWIHGGGYIQGSSTYEMYNGSNLAAKKDVVLVSINYRLGVLGFLALEALAKEDPNGSTGNYGMLDVIRALEWVRDNISNFDGDPNNVTIFGQSAGSVITCNLLASPPAAGLFHKAINMSGACDMATYPQTSYPKGLEYAKSLRCEGKDIADCLRGHPSSYFVETKNLVTWAHIDGYVLKEMPITALKTGRYNKVPVMAGSARDEMNLALVMAPFLRLMPKKLIVKRIYKSQGEETARKMLELYPINKFSPPIKMVLKMVADGFAARAYAQAEQVSKNSDVFLYRFDWDDIRRGKTAGAFHGLDIPPVFGNTKLQNWIGIGLFFKSDAVQQKAEPLSEKMMSYYTNFARTGNPNGAGLPEWPKYSSATKLRLHFDNDITFFKIGDDEIEKFDLLNSRTVEQFGGDMF